MIDTFDGVSFTQDDASGLLLPTQVRRTVHPWDDLSVLNPPGTYRSLSTELLSSLAILTARGPSVPRLVRCTDSGALATFSRVGWIAKTVTFWPAGQQSVIVDDVSQIAPSDVCQVTYGPVGSQQTFGGLAVDQVLPDGTLHFESFNTADVPIGSVLTQIPQIGISFAGRTVSLDSRQVNTAIGVVSNTVDGAPMVTTTVNRHRRLAVDDVRSYDWDGVGEGGTGVQTVVQTSSFGVGFRSVATLLFASVENSGGAAVAQYVELWSGAAGSGTRKLRIPMYVPAATSKEVVLAPVRFQSADNGFWTWQQDRATAGVLGHLTIAGYVEG